MTKSGVNLICEERARHDEKLGWTAEHDDDHVEGDLAMAAACYAATGRIFVRRTFANGMGFSDPWPWPGEYCDARPHDGNVLIEIDPTPESPKEREARIRRLVKAGALIAAEIDRLHRCK